MSLAISNLSVKSISFMMPYTNMSEVKEGKIKNKNRPECLEKCNNKLHNWLLHLQLPLRHLCLDA